MKAKVNRFTRNAMCIETENYTYVGSYKTLVCRRSRLTGLIEKYWNGYSPSTMSHIRHTACSSVGYKDTWEKLPIKKDSFSEEEILVSRYIEKKGHYGSKPIWATWSGRSYSGDNPVGDPLVQFTALSRI